MCEGATVLPMASCEGVMLPAWFQFREHVDIQESAGHAWAALQGLRGISWQYSSDNI